MGIPMARDNLPLDIDTIFDVAVIGAGPAGSTAAAYLVEAGLKVCLIEKKSFPREVLCGEFVSPEVINSIIDFNKLNEFHQLNPNPVTQLRIINNNGKQISSDLGFTAYGLRRSLLDKFLLDAAIENGAKVYQPYKIVKVKRQEKFYRLLLEDESKKEIYISSKKVLAAYGKQNILDKKLNRDFTDQQSGLNGIKFHLPSDLIKNLPSNEIRIYLDDDLYCGINKVDDEIITICFLEKGNKEIHPREKLVNTINKNKSFIELFKSGFEDYLLNADIYGTSSIFFGKRKLVEDGIFMIGDAAKVIAPLAGDGIGMAMESAKLVSKILIDENKKIISEKEAEQKYISLWNKHFNARTEKAMLLQRLFFKKNINNIAFIAASLFPSLTKYFVKNTRSREVDLS